MCTCPVSARKALKLGPLKIARRRSKVEADELAHAMPRLCPRRGSPEAQALERAEAEEAAGGRGAASAALAAADLEWLRLMQRRHARLFEQQRKRVSKLVT